MEHENVGIRYRDDTVRDIDLDILEWDSIDKDHDIITVSNRDHYVAANKYLMFELYTLYLYIAFMGVPKGQWVLTPFARCLLFFYTMFLYNIWIFIYKYTRENNYVLAIR